ncbi:MAG: DUF1538 domain-containing protein [Proteobacteria bacterium]|nr:DUF1538 domain-containing protein [Pseudomonadota bacterium]
MALVEHLSRTALATLADVTPIVVVLFVFQALIIRRRPPNLRRIAAGTIYVIVGMTLFLVGLGEALFPIGETMARQLSASAFVGGAAGATDWRGYGWAYAFAAAIGFACTIAEPALIAVARKAHEVSGGTVRPGWLRLVVALGVSVGVALGALRIVTGIPLVYFILVGYAVVVVQTMRVDRSIVALAYDSGGVTTSTVTVPILAALGLGLASTVPGRNPLVDGFGLIAFAALFPMLSVMGYALLASRLTGRKGRGEEEDAE